MRTTKAQISLRVHTVWSGTSLSAYIIIIEYIDREDPDQTARNAQADLECHWLHVTGWFSHVEAQTIISVYELVLRKIYMSYLNIENGDQSVYLLPVLSTSLGKMFFSLGILF